MEEKNGQFRKKRVYFTQVSNNALRDKNLSLKAKGLYSLIQSFLTIENFILYKSTLKKYCSEGEKAFESTWKELKDKGYLIQYRLKDEKGFFYYEYDLLDLKNIELAEKIHASQNRKTKDEKNHTPKTVGMDKNKESIPTKTDDMDNVEHENDEVYNNTSLTNTNLTNTNLLVEESIVLFEENICILKKSTREQFIRFCKKYDIEFIRALIILCAEYNTKYFAGFKFIINEYIEKNITTKESLEKHILKFREKNKKMKNKKKINTKKDSTFNNFKQRDYDFEDLKNKLLGWDKQ